MSVMNYNFGFGLILTDGSFELDYSRFNLSLNEGSLDEETGFGVDERAADRAADDPHAAQTAAAGSPSTGSR